MSINVALATENLEADELLALASFDIEKGQLESGLLKLKKILSMPEPNPEAIAMAARLYAQIGLLPRAKDLFQRYLQSNPAAINEQFQLGMVHFDSRELKDAQKIWEEILASTPIHPPALYYMGLLNAQQNQLGDARRHLEVLLKSVATDNLYFERSKELLQAIDNSLQGMLVSENPMHPAANTPYQVEH